MRDGSGCDDLDQVRAAVLPLPTWRTVDVLALIGTVLLSLMLLGLATLAILLWFRGNAGRHR